MKVGAFVLAGLLGAGRIIFLIGDNRSLFDSKVPFRTQFDDVQGVKPGSTVRMGGVDIGTVSRVQYPADPGQTLIDVEISVVKREAARIREGSKASIAAKGLLGDKMVSIVAGPPDRPPIAAGGRSRASPRRTSRKRSARSTRLPAARRVCSRTWMRRQVRSRMSRYATTCGAAWLR
jgi:phospholipid/cholesterol/gamma-HCH transport system substrate-binding protein